MNTSKQVNIMIGLMFLVVIAFGIYFIWDLNVRSGRAADRQVEENAIRGAKLFATNCRVCHGPNGLGRLENPNFPGLPHNLEDNRPTEDSKLKPLRQRFVDTIKCGRVGTLMPPWAQAQGGSLNDTQIDQLATLITGSGPDGPSSNPNRVSVKAWEAALETAIEQDTLLTPEGDILRIAGGAPLSANAIVIILNDAHVGFALDQLLRIEEEIVKVTAFPASSKLTESVSAADTVLNLETSADFAIGTLVQADQEKMRVVSVDAAAKTITVERGVDGTSALPHRKEAVVQDPYNGIQVERGAFSTDAVEHADGTQVFNGPIPPPEGPLTGESATPPCGQRGVVPLQTPAPGGAAVPTPSPGQPERPATTQPVQAEFVEPVNGIIETVSQDNFFTVNNFKVSVGQEVTIRVSNEGQAIHNLRIAGLDGQWETEDDFVTGPDLLRNGEVGEFTFSLDEPATLIFRCDFHPTESWGQITVG